MHGGIIHDVDAEVVGDDEEFVGFVFRDFVYAVQNGLSLSFFRIVVFINFILRRNFLPVHRLTKSSVVLWHDRTRRQDRGTEALVEVELHDIDHVVMDDVVHVLIHGRVIFHSHSTTLIIVTFLGFHSFVRLCVVFGFDSLHITCDSVPSTQLTQLKAQLLLNGAESIEKIEQSYFALLGLQMPHQVVGEEEVLRHVE